MTRTHKPVTITLDDDQAALVAVACVLLAAAEATPEEARVKLNRITDDVLERMGA